MQALSELILQAEADIAAADDLAALDAVRVAFLGKKGALTARMKGLDFRRVALGDFLSSIVGIGFTLTLAFLWRDVWALVIGHLIGTAARSLASYWVAPHRPHFHFDRGALKELLHYQLGAVGAPFLLLMIFTSGPLILGKLISKGAVAVWDGAAGNIGGRKHWSNWLEFEVSL